MWFAQTPTPALPVNATLPENVQIETIVAHPSFTMAQSGLLILYFVVALALVVCVTVQTSKSEGLMQQSIAGPSGPTGGKGGKVTSDERLAGVTTNLAYTFLFLSAIVAYLIKIVAH